MNSQIQSKHADNKTKPKVQTPYSSNINQLYPNSKSHLLDLVKRDDVLHFRSFNPINLLCNLSPTDENYTIIHHCAKVNSYRLMSYFLGLLVEKLKIDIKTIINLQESSQGNTPSMICAINNNPETLLVILLLDSIDVTIENKNKLKLKDLCEIYSQPCRYFLSKNFNSKSSLSDEDENLLRPGFIKFYQKTKQSSNINFFSLENFTRKTSPSTNLNSNELYNDQEFQPIKTSICKPEVHSFKKLSKVIWLRPFQIYKKKQEDIVLFDLTWDISKVVQGDLENCYLIAVLSALCQHPQRLLGIFCQTGVHSQGLYSLQLYDRGVPKEIIIDDLIPVLSSAKTKPLFSYSTGSEIWPVLIEKAFAKIYGDYFSCEHGYSDEAIEILLGCPSVQIVVSKYEEKILWEYIGRALNRNYLICLTTLPNSSEISKLTDSHAFSLVSVHEHGDLKLLKLRDPRNVSNWKGEYYKKSKLWTLELLDEVGDISTDKGLFCITLAEVKKLFEYISVGLYEEGYFYSYLEYKPNYRTECFAKLKLEAPCNLYLRVHQEDLRKKLKRAAKKSEYNPVEIFIAKLEDSGQLTAIINNPDDLDTNSSWGARSIFANEAKLIKFAHSGEYIIRVMVLNREEDPEPITLSTYSSRQVSLSNLEVEANFLEKYFEGVERISNLKKEIKAGFLRAESFFGNYCWFYFENQREKKIKIKFEIQFLENLEFLNKSHEKGEITLEPTSTRVLILKKVKINKTASYKFKWNYYFD